MSRSTFFSLVLPPTGSICITGLMSDKSGPPKQRFFESPEAAEPYITALGDEGREVYFGCATYADPKGQRTAKNTEGFKSFYIDIDCGPGKPYASHKDGLTALGDFLTESKLPMPTIVDSGRGFHGYWTLNAPISYNEWRPVADAFKKLMDELKFETDPAVTADGARILRIPGTFNNKDRENPKEVTVVKFADPIEFAEFKQLVHAVDTASGDFIPPMDDVTRALLRSSEANFSKIMKRSLKEMEVTETVEIITENKDGSKSSKTAKQKVMRSQGCAQLAHAHIQQATLPEPLWRAALSIAAHCVDASTAIHIISQKHEEYDPVETHEKAEGTKAAGPHLCKTFQKLNPALCLTCPLKGKINSPISLGSTIIPATATDNIREQIWHEGLKEYVDVDIPLSYPAPWLRPKHGGVALKGALQGLPGAESEGDEEPEESLVYANDIWVKKRLIDPTYGEVLQIARILPKDGMKEFMAPVALISKKDKCQEILSSHGIATLDRRMDLLRRYIVDWMHLLQNQNSAEHARSQFGWHDNDTRFVIGSREITRDGTVLFSPPSSVTEDIAPLYSSKGTLEMWRTIANIYDAVGNEARAFALFASFGAPLYKFFGLGSPIIHLTNSASGVGKSTAQMVGNSVWGHPVDTLLNENDTNAAKQHRAGVLNNILFTVDELTNIAPEEISDFIFRFSFNRGRNRMQSQINAERKNNTTYATIGITSGNNSLYDSVKSHKSSSEGEMYRIIEIQVLKDESLTKEQSDYYFNQLLLENYGLAGEELMKYVTANLEAVKVMLFEEQKSFDKLAGFMQKERYYSACCAAAITGAKIAHRLGLHNIDVDRVRNWLIQTMTSVTVTVTETSNDDATNLLGRFLNENLRNTLVIEGIAKVIDGVTLPRSEIQRPVGDLVIRYEPDTHKIFVSISKIRSWCTAQRIPFDGLRENLKRVGVLIEERSIQMGRGTVMPGGSVLALCCNSTALNIPIDKIKEQLVN